ncbi:MAG TPA: hypothetical protein VGE47_16245 [Burkholderiaceae bacterium]
MDLIQLPPNALRLGQVLTFSVRDANGKLLFATGQVLHDSPQVRSLIEHGAFALAHETKEYQRQLAHKVDTMMHQGAVLGEIAKAQAVYKPDPKVEKRSFASDLDAWNEIQSHAHALLRDPKPIDFLPRFETLHAEMMQLLQRNADALLTLLVHDASRDFRQYSSKHGLLCMALAELCGQRLGWSDAWRAALTRAALSLNVRISVAQDRLAASSDTFTPEQREQLMHLSYLNADYLRSLGVTDPLWLDTLAVRHETGPGPLADRSPAEQLARLLSRIDIFAARLSPRRSRAALSAGSAARAVFLDELKHPDEAGAALVKAVGLYVPGSLVRLVNGEVGIVFKRGPNANEPLVAALMGKSGNPLADPVPRDTRLASQAVAGSLAPHELKLNINLEKLHRLYRLA